MTGRGIRVPKWFGNRRHYAVARRRGSQRLAGSSRLATARETTFKAVTGELTTPADHNEVRQRSTTTCMTLSSASSSGLSSPT
jgi:hypothetical protein